MGSWNPISWIEEAVEAVIDFGEEVVGEVGEVFEEGWNTATGLAEEAWEGVTTLASEVTGIEEIHPDYEEQQIAEAEAAYAAEMATLQAKLKSSNAADRLAAEQRMQVLKGQHNKYMKQAQKDYLRKKIKGGVENKKALQLKEAEIAQNLKDGEDSVTYDKDKMSKIVQSAKLNPTIPASDAPSRGVGPTGRDTALRRPS